MPNHYILLLRQDADGGVHYFSYHVHEAITSYYQALFKDIGELFHDPVVTEILTHAELFAAVRYINLLPNRNDIVQDALDGSYPWSSYQELLLRKKDMVVDITCLAQIFGGKAALDQFIHKGFESGSRLSSFAINVPSRQ
jgi:hypothetical protein